MEVRNKRLSDEDFFKERKEVLAEWPTGNEVDLDEAVDYQKSLPPNKNYGKKLEEAKQKGTIYPISGMGHTTVEQEAELLKYTQDSGPADLLAVSVDTFTRIHDYKAVERGIQESERTGTSVLNGFPVVNYGVAGMRKVFDALDVPLQSRFGAPDGRLICEILFAGGVNGMSGGLLVFFQYSSRVPFETVIRNFQYVWRLEGYYQEKGVLFSDVPYSGIGGFLTPPSAATAGNVLQLLLMAEQGIKCFTLRAGGNGCLVQDAANAKTIRKLAREYLDKFGYRDTTTSFLEASFSGRMPADPVRAFGHICVSCLCARVCGAQYTFTRSISEGRAIAIKDDLAQSYRCANTFINLLRDQKIELDSKAVDEEAEMEELEARAIIDKVIDLGDGDVAIGLVRGLESGVIDCSYPSHPSVPGKLMGLRDADGAVRWLDHGNLPFTRDILDFHKEKLAERSKKLGRPVGYGDLVNELISIGTGHLDIQ